LGDVAPMVRFWLAAIPTERHYAEGMNIVTEG
jgi:hypothetical protein